MNAPVEFDNILIIRPRYLGDVILATPLASAAKKARPSSRVTFLVDSTFAECLEGHPDVDEVLGFDVRRKNNLFYLWEFLRALRKRKFDAVLDLFGNPRTAQWTFLSGAPVRVGFKLRGRTWAYNRVAPPSSPVLPSGRRRVTEAYLDQWRALGHPSPESYATSLAVAASDAASAEEFLRKSGVAPGGKVAVFAPGASHPAKHWPLGKFMLLARRFASGGVRPLFILGPKDQTLAAELENALEKDWLFVNQPALRHLAALVKAADLLVSNDAGPMHVGPAVGTPTVGIFGPGEPEIWFPYDPPHRAAHWEMGCSHCGRDVCIKDPPAICMEKLEVDEVEALARQALSGKTR